MTGSQKVRGSTPLISTTSEQSAFDDLFALWRKHPSTPLLFLLPKKPTAFRGPRKSYRRMFGYQSICSTKIGKFLLKLADFTSSRFSKIEKQYKKDTLPGVFFSSLLPNHGVNILGHHTISIGVLRRPFVAQLLYICHGTCPSGAAGGVVSAVGFSHRL